MAPIWPKPSSNWFRQPSPRCRRLTATTTPAPPRWIRVPRIPRRHLERPVLDAARRRPPGRGQSFERARQESMMTKPTIPGPDPDTRAPKFRLPPLACDAHTHIFGPGDKYPYAPGRPYTPPDAPLED